MSFVRVPLLIGYQFDLSNKFKLTSSLGPRLSFLTSSSEQWTDASDEVTDLDNNFKNANSTLIAGELRLTVAFIISEKNQNSLSSLYNIWVQ